MRPDHSADASGEWRLWLLVCGLAAVSAAVSASLYLFHCGDFFVGDDLVLISESLRGDSLLKPVSAHLRPVLRLHFQLYRLAPYPAFFHVFSLLLHGAASVASYFLFREIHGRKIALPACLLFFTSFLGNEAVFWISSVSMLYCALFALVSMVAFARRRFALSLGFLVLAMLSNELWLVVPPLLFLLHRRLRELIAPAVLGVGYLAVNLLVFGSQGASSYGGFSAVDFPQRFSIYLFRLFTPLIGNPSWAVSLALSAGLLGLAAFPRLRFPALLYAGSALLLSLSEFTPSRFYYIPSLGLVVILGVGLSSRPVPRMLAGLLALYLAVVSPWVTLLDGRDYGRKAVMHEGLFESVSRELDRLGDGDTAVLVNRMGPQPLFDYAAGLEGREKPVFVREDAIGGMLFPEDVVRISLWRRGRTPAPGVPPAKAIEVGRDEVRSSFLFRVQR
jgi:hypothetical protein